MYNVDTVEYIYIYIYEILISHNIQSPTKKLLSYASIDRKQSLSQWYDNMEFFS